MYIPFSGFFPLFLCSFFQFLLHSDSSIDIIWLYISKYIFPAYIIHMYNWKFVAWDQRISSYTLLHHHLEPQFHICPYYQPFYIVQLTIQFLQNLIYGLPISNGFIFERWRSYTFFLLNFHKPVWILTCVKSKKLFL